MIQILSLLLFLITIHSCRNKRDDDGNYKRAYQERQTQKLDTVIALHDKCEECFDLADIQESLTVPADLKQYFPNNVFDFKIIGNFPYELIKENYDPNIAFRLLGKIVAVDTTNEVGNIPIFYAEKVDTFYFDLLGWKEKDEFNYYVKRKLMIKGIVQNMLFKGKTINSIIQVFGNPDEAEGNKIIYRVDELIESPIKRRKSQNFEITFNNYTIITEIKLRQPKYGT